MGSPSPIAARFAHNHLFNLSTGSKRKGLSMTAALSSRQAPPHAPANTTATVYVPTSDAATIRESRQPATEAEGMPLLRQETDTTVYQVTTGRYHFTAAC